MDNDSNNKMKW